MSAPKHFLAMGFVLAIFGIVGRLDYEDALLTEHARGYDAVRLICRRTSVEPLVFSRVPFATVATSLPVTFNPDDELPSPTFQELRCVVVNE